MKREIFVGLLMLVVGGANAHAEGFFDDGDTLNYTCREEKGSFARGACLGTVSGALDMMSDARAGQRRGAQVSC